jgi:uncharacterized protein YutE (UPF0331/DUF86 family)
MTHGEVIDRHLRDLEQMVAQLQRHQGRSLDELRADQLLSLAVERALQRAIQNLLDISIHLLSGAGINDWDDYRGAILKLGEAGVVPREFAERISGMAGLRNILVHGYLEVEIDKIWEILHHHLDDFRTFARYIVECLTREEGL